MHSRATGLNARVEAMAGFATANHFPTTFFEGEILLRNERPIRAQFEYCFKAVGCIVRIRKADGSGIWRAIFVAPLDLRDEDMEPPLTPHQCMITGFRHCSRSTRAV
jgi:hypothetical protein